MATYTLEQIDAKIAEWEAKVEEFAGLPDGGSTGSTSYSGAGGGYGRARQQLDLWQRRKAAYYNGGRTLPRRRCC